MIGFIIFTSRPSLPHRSNSCFFQPFKEKIMTHWWSFLTKTRSAHSRTFMAHWWTFLTKEHSSSCQFFLVHWETLLTKNHPFYFKRQLNPERGFIYGHFLPHRVAHINLLDKLWLIDDHFWQKNSLYCVISIVCNTLYLILVFASLMNIFDQKPSILFHAPAQPREGFICVYFLPHRVAPYISR